MLTLKIISPEREVLSEKVDLVELPGSQGRFEVLRDHAPLVSSLDEGVIRYDGDFDGLMNAENSDFEAIIARMYADWQPDQEA